MWDTAQLRPTKEWAAGSRRLLWAASVHSGELWWPLSTQENPGGLCPLRGAPGRQKLCPKESFITAPTYILSHPNTCCQPFLTLPAVSPLSPQNLPLVKTQQKHRICVIPYFFRGCQLHPAISPCICPDVGQRGYPLGREPGSAFSPRNPEKGK